MTDDTNDYEELLPDRTRAPHYEWFWMFAGASVGSASAGAATIWAGLPPWSSLAAGLLMFCCCVAVQHRYDI